MDFITGATVGFVFGAWFGIAIMCLVSITRRDDE